MRKLPFVADANGRRILPSELRISFADTGFLMGITVSERLRTFGGELFLLEEHLQRLARSLEVVGTKLDVSLEQLAVRARSLVAHNYRLLCDAGRGGWDLGLGIFVTGGADPTSGMASSEPPLVGMHTYPLDFGRWAAHYETGARLVTAEVRQISPANWPLSLKCRSRMHYFLAAQQVGRQHPGAVALLLNPDGSISETPTANVLFVRDDARLVSPPKDRILPGISLGHVERLSQQFGWPMEFRPVFPQEIPEFAEIWLTSTPFCALPVSEVDGTNIGTGRPGSLFDRLISEWGIRVGCKIPEQARNCVLDGPAAGQAWF